MAPPIPITVLGGYLGAGKTTLLNRLLSDPGGRRLGVIVNDFGSIGVDAELLEAATDSGIVNLPNGCICCTLGGDLFEALAVLRAAPVPPDHIVVEASGVADPSVAAAWGTSVGFEPGGVVVLAAADSIGRQVGDKYVGGEVRLQLAGADLLILTKTDLCAPPEVDRATQVVTALAPQTPVAPADLPIDAVLGLRPTWVAGPGAAAGTDGARSAEHDDRYRRWSWTGGVVDESELRTLLGDLPAGLLRMKGWVDVGSQQLLVQVVGRRVALSAATMLPGGADRSADSRLVAIGLSDRIDLDHLTGRFDAIANAAPSVS